MGSTGVFQVSFQTWLTTVSIGSILFHVISGNKADDDTVFFNNFGDCQRLEPLELKKGKISLQSFGGDVAYEALFCSMTFHASSGGDFCLYFNDFYVSDCDVTLKVYTSKTASGKPMVSLSCGDTFPGQVCSPNRYFTVVLVKRRETYNKGYRFHLDLIDGGENGLFEDPNRQAADIFEANENGSQRPTIAKSEKKSTSATPLFISVLCILAVIVLVVATAAVALYFCRRQRGVYTGESCSDREATQSPLAEDVEGIIARPTAPPEEEPPPPYVDPPPYDAELHGAQSYGEVYENRPIMANR